MVSNPPGDCCLSGFARPGNPVGEMEKIDNIATYYARPTGSSANNRKAVLFLSDIFGIYQNSKLLSDALAEKGYLTLLPDLFEGDSVPFEPYVSGKFDIKEWGSRHSTEQVDPIVERVISHMRENLGIERIATVGYCFGGKWSVRFLREGKIDVGYTAHPSFISREELENIQGPLSIAAAGIDNIFTAELRHESEEILSKTLQPYQLNLFYGVTHGFAVRSDLSKPDIKFAQESAFQQAVAWFDHYL